MDDTRQCHATSKRSGERCRKAAIIGGSVCRMHGGGAPQVVRAARRRVAHAEVLSILGTEVEVVPVHDPVAALAMLAGETEALRAILRDQLAQLESVDASGRAGFERAAILVGLYNDTIGRAQKLLTALARLDLEDRGMTVDERVARGLVMAVTRTVEALGVRATPQEVSALMAANLQAARVQMGAFELGS